jgi:hypothetical protein
VFSKGYSGKRATAFARHVQTWQPLDTSKWMPAAPPELCHRYYRRTQTVRLRWQSEKTRRFKHALLIWALMDGERLHVSPLYDQRARIENEIKADQAGLLLPRRRKKHWHAQHALGLLTDLAPNILAWTPRFWAPEPALSDVGIYCIVNEILPIPGKPSCDERGLVKWRLQVTHPLAKPVLSGLSRR